MQLEMDFTLKSEVMIDTEVSKNRLYRAHNFCWNDGFKWADVEGYYGPIAGWRKVGCKNRIRQIAELLWDVS